MHHSRGEQELRSDRFCHMEAMGCGITPRDWTLGRCRIRSHSVCLRKYPGLSFAKYEAPEGDQRALQQVERLDTTASGRLLAQPQGASGPGHGQG
jgi:hypothetical protein